MSTFLLIISSYRAVSTGATCRCGLGFRPVVVLPKDLGGARVSDASGRERALMSEWFALRPIVATEAPGPKRTNERRPPADTEADVSPVEDSSTDE
jgi:hypothetical protein